MTKRSKNKIGRKNTVSTMAIALRQCRIADNDEGRTDTLYRRYSMTPRQAMQAHPSAKIQDMVDDKKKKYQRLEFIHAVEPNEDGVRGGFAKNKPFPSIVYCETTNEIVSHSGFDSFPYSVSRLNKRPGSPYGYGWGMQILPIARLLNRIETAILRAAEYAVDPPLAIHSNQLGRINRRPGSITKFNPSMQYGVQDPSNLIHKLYEGGDPVAAFQMVQDLRRQIEMANYVDWQTLPDQGTMTATEVNDRRSMRLQLMSPVVSRIEAEKLEPIASRHFELMQASNVFLSPEEFGADNLHDEEIEFEYKSPMAQAQESYQVEVAANLLGITEQAITIDPNAADVTDVPEILRHAHKSAGGKAMFTRSREEVEAAQEARQQQQEQLQQIEQATQIAQGARDGAQAAASLGLGANGAINREAA